MPTAIGKLLDPRLEGFGIFSPVPVSNSSLSRSEPSTNTMYSIARKVVTLRSRIGTAARPPCVGSILRPAGNIRLVCGRD
ncbi:MAG TPA: hypothetical protein VJ837_06305, partial [Candidatus Paceibacterota bacterium]|nr:hypothetical protein [Candidatus Paceibacterota bacterium]